MTRFAELGVEVEEITVDIENLEDCFLALRSQQFVIDRELQLQSQRDLIKPDIIWNTELGLNQSTSDLAAAERARAALYRQFTALFADYDLLVTPGANTPAFDVNLRHPEAIDGVRLETLSGCFATDRRRHIVGIASPVLALRLRSVRPPGRTANWSAGRAVKPPCSPLPPCSSRQAVWLPDCP